MPKALLLTTVLLVVLFGSVSTLVRVWDACGGADYHGDTVCCPGLECCKIDDFYSQCRPIVSWRANVSLEWEQCGGRKFRGFTTCDTGLDCVYYDEQYSRCERPWHCQATTPAPTTTEGSTTTQPTTTAPPTTTTPCHDSAVWEQCGGGVDFQGSNQCSPGLECVYVDRFYSQCRPADSRRRKAEEWEQCDGRKYLGPRTCAVGLKCVFYTVFYSQCERLKPCVRRRPRPYHEDDDDDDDDDDESGEYRRLRRDGLLKRGQVCGGKAYRGPTKCAEGLSCVVKSPWSSQCQPTLTHVTTTIEHNEN